MYTSRESSCYSQIIAMLEVRPFDQTDESDRQQTCSPTTLEGEGLHNTTYVG